MSGEGGLSMNIGIIAHNSKKSLIEDFCIAYKGILAKHEIYATGTTGRRIEEVTNLHVHKFLAGSVGGDKQFMAMIERNAMTYDYDTSDYVIRMRRSTNGFTGALPKSVYEEAELSFEGHLLKVPKGYDIWLTRFFGDYMTLPPEEKRVTHPIRCYYRD